MSDNQEVTTFNNSNEMIFNRGAMSSMMELAKVMASAAATMPKHLKGNVGDCLAIIMQSAQWRMSPWAVAQKSHLIKGTLGYEGQLVNAVIVNSGVVAGRFKYEFFGDWTKVQGKVKFVKSRVADENGEFKDVIYKDWKPEDEFGLGVTISNTIKGDSEPTSLRVLLVQATVRNSTLWHSDPQQQICYFAVKKWSRLHTPDVTLGVYTIDELEDDNAPGEIIINPFPGEETEPVKKIDIKVILESIKTMAIADFNKIDKDTLTAEEQNAVRAAFKARKKEIIESQVVATINPTTEEQAPDDKTDWLQMLVDAEDPQAFAACFSSIPEGQIKEITNSIPDDKMSSIIERITTKELIEKFYGLLTKEKQSAFADDFSFANDVLMAK